MTIRTQKFSKPVLAGAIRVVTLVLFLVALGSFAYVANAATGSGIFEAQFDLCANTSSGTYTGTISRPNSH
jgi:hypothetical protein